MYAVEEASTKGVLLLIFQDTCRVGLILVVYLLQARAISTLHHKQRGVNATEAESLCICRRLSCGIACVLMQAT